jgi:hypothetical protein
VIKKYTREEKNVPEHILCITSMVECRWFDLPKDMYFLTGGARHGCVCQMMEAGVAGWRRILW